MTAIEFTQAASRRRRLRPSWDLATLLLVLGAIGLVIGTFHDYGIT